MDRAIKAVSFLRDRYEWRTGIEIGDEEPPDVNGERGVFRDGPIAAPMREASTPASAPSDEANEAQVTEDVLGEMGPTPA